MRSLVARHPAVNRADESRMWVRVLPHESTLGVTAEVRTDNADPHQRHSHVSTGNGEPDKLTVEVTRGRAPTTKRPPAPP